MKRKDFIALKLIIKNKKRFRNIKPQGVTLIEVMIVLAISGVMILAAIGTFTARSGVVFNASIDNVASDLRAVANETRNGLGPSGSGTSCGITDESCQLSGGVATNSAIFGEAVEFSNDHCPGTATTPTSCMIVYKLMKPTDTSIHTVTPYERYVITLPSNLTFKLPVGGNNPLVVYTNTGEVYGFNIPTGNVVGAGSPPTTVANKFSSTGASTSTNYTALNRTAPNIFIVDRADANIKAKLKIDMQTPINVEVERDAT